MRRSSCSAGRWPLPPSERILWLAVGARTGRVFVFYLDFDAGGFVGSTELSPDGGFQVGDSARKLAVADFNGDTFP